LTDTSDDRPLGLVVDDYSDGRDVARHVLESMGLRTIEASNGHDALDSARRNRPDVLVLDLALPGLDGWAVARELKTDPATADMLIVAFTAHAEADPLERAREAGCDAVLTKPCPPRLLAESIRTLLDRRSMEAT
jgi:CheY-like chemotaxis protein